MLPSFDLASATEAPPADGGVVVAAAVLGAPYGEFEVLAVVVLDALPQAATVRATAVAAAAAARDLRAVRDRVAVVMGDAPCWCGAKLRGQPPGRRTSAISSRHRSNFSCALRNRGRLPRA